MGSEDRLTNIDGLVDHGLLDAIPDGMIVSTPEGEIRAINRRVETITGYQTSELIGQPVELLVPRHLRSDHESHRAAFAESGFPSRPMGQDLDIRLLRRDGESIAADIALSSLDTDSGTLVVATVRDATPRRRMQALADERERRLRQLYENAPLLILGQDAEGLVTDCNPELCGLFELGSGEIIGRPASDIMSGHGRGLMERLREGDDYVRNEGEITPPERRPRRVGWHTISLRDSSGGLTGALSIGEDLTDRVRQQRSITAMQAVTGAILQGQDPSQIQRMICDEATDLVGATVAMVATKGGAGDEIEVVAISDRVHHDPRGGALIEGLWSRIDPDTTGPQIFDVSRDDPSPADRHLGPVALLPLPGESGYGFLVVADEAGAPPFDTEALDTLEAFSSQVALALAYGRRLRRIAIADDRDRIARDLHDLVIQRLFAAGLSLQATAQALDDQPDVALRLQHVADSLDTAIAELRQSIFHLERKTEHDLRRRVEDIVDDVVSEHELHSNIDVAGDSSTVSEDKIAHMLATLREALTNAGRHARASRVDVVIAVGPDLALIVRDDGVGLPKTMPPSGHGLVNLRQRAQQLGGTLRLSDGERGGLELEWRVPL